MLTKARLSVFTLLTAHCEHKNTAPSLASIIIAFCIILSTSNVFSAGEQVSYVRQKFLGINPRINPKLLQDDEAVDASNITLDETGAFKDRETFGQYNSSSGVLGNNAITFLGKYYTSSSKYFIACAGSKVALGSAGVFTTDITPTTNTVTSGTYWSACTFNNIEYLFNPSVPMMKYDTVKSALYPPVSTPTTNCAYGTIHKNRGWAARSDSIKYRLYYSSLINLEDWTTTGGYIDLPDMSQEITGIISWGGYLFVLTEVQIFRLDGSTPNNFSLTKTNSSVGAIAPRTIKVSDIGIIFLSRTGLFAFDGNASHKLSDKVEPLINSISKTQIQNACGIFDGQSKYWLSYTEQGASYNNKILIYDTILKEWYPYDNLNISYFERAYGGTDRGELYGASATTNGIVYLLQEATGTESITHSTQSDFKDGVTSDTVTTTNPYHTLVNGNDIYTKLLAHFNGVNGATTYTTEDYAKRTITFNPVCSLDTSIKKYGSSSVTFDGINGNLSIPDSADWNFGSGNFTIDAYVYLTAQPGVGSGKTIISQWQAAGDQRAWGYAYRNEGGAYNFRFTYSTDGTAAGVVSLEVNHTLTLNTWTHVAVIRSGTDLKFYADGVQVGTTQSIGTAAIFDSTDLLRISIFDSVEFWIGNIDEIRISKDIARTTSLTPLLEHEYAEQTFGGTLTSSNIQINASGQTTLDRITWIDTLPSSDTKITFQTRTGATNDSVYFNGWQYWSSANSVTLNTVTDGTVIFTSSAPSFFRLNKPFYAQRRNVLFYEDEDVVSANCVSVSTVGAVSKGRYIEAFIPTTNLSGYDWLGGWFKSSQTGHTVEFYIGEGVSSNNYVTFNTVTDSTVDGWQKWYWYIGGMSASSRDNINYIKYRYVGDAIGDVTFAEVSAYNFYDSSDTISSTPNDWMQYRAILGSNSSGYVPMLSSVSLSYTPALSVLESSLSSFYHTKWIDFQSPQINKQFTDFYVDVYTVSPSTGTLQPFYFDFDIDNGQKTGTITIPSSSTVTDNTIKIKKYFPSSTYGKTIQLKYRNPNAKTNKHVIEGIELRFRPEPLGN